MLHALTLVAPRGAADLADAIAALRATIAQRDLIHLGETVLAPEQAVDLLLDLPAANTAHLDVAAVLDGRPVDWALQPALNRMKKLLIADMDSTIIGQECLDELARYAGVGETVAAITERAMRGELDFEGALAERVAMIAGLELSVLQRCFDEAITLNPGATTLLATMRAHGAWTALVSGGFTFFTGRVAAAAGFDEHRANVLLDDGERLTGAVAQPILGKEAKRQTLAELTAARGLDAHETLAVGDGANDLLMLEAAGLGVAYHAKPVVAAAAKARVVAGDLTSLLFFQGYRDVDFVKAP